MMRINDFVESELEYFRVNCNFSDQEMIYFNMRAKGKTNLEISLELDVCENTVVNIGRRVKKKMIKVI